MKTVVDRVVARFSESFGLSFSASSPRSLAFLIGEFAGSVGVATPMLDRAVELYDKFMAMGLEQQDVAAMVDVISSLPRSKT